MRTTLGIMILTLNSRKVGEVGMTIEIAGAIAVGALIWAIYSTIKMSILEDKICYLKGQIEALIRGNPTQTNAKKQCVGCALKEGQ